MKMAKSRRNNSENDDSSFDCNEDLLAVEEISNSPSNFKKIVDEDAPKSASEEDDEQDVSVFKELETFLDNNSDIKKIKAKNIVDLNLRDSEIWIVQCPKSIGIENELKDRKIVLDATEKPIEIEGSNLECCIEANSSTRPVSVLCGTKFKSFIPAGSIRIKEKLVATDFRIKNFSQMGIKIDEKVPFPENLKVRHPLLGADYESRLKLPKKVRVQLELAKQTTPTSPSTAKVQKPRQKRKLQKEIPSSLESLSKKKSKSGKKEIISEEDDVSWIKNI